MQCPHIMQADPYDQACQAELSFSSCQRQSSEYRDNFEIGAPPGKFYAVAMFHAAQTGDALPILQPTDTSDVSQVFMLSEAPLGMQIGSVQIPTLGSLGHTAGTCKPCVFLHTKGCTNGVQCSFCHLCPRGEKHKRQKAKQDAAKKMRETHRERRQKRAT